MRARRLLQVGSLASVPQFVDFATRFARTIILSRLLLPNEFGIAVAITVVVTIAELISDIGIEKFLMSRPRGDDRAALAGAHVMTLVRGIALAAVIYAAAPALAAIFGTGENGAAFRWCAAIMLVRSLAHLQVAQAQRDFNYGPQAATMLTARFVALAVVFPAVALWPDYRAMGASLIVDAAVYAAMSHGLARSRYSLVIGDRRILRELLSYGLPLTFNGMLWAANSQADRAIVSHWIGLEALALYAVIFNLATVPVTVIYSILNLLGMSLLARTHEAAELRAKAYLALIWVHAVAAAAFAVGTAALLDLLVPLIYGKSYVVPPLTQPLIALIVWMRLNRGGPNTLMLFGQDTKPLMLGNLVLAVGLVLAVLLLPLFPRLETMLACLLIGETLSLVFFLYVARNVTTASNGAVVGQLGWSFAPVALAGAAAALFSPDEWWWRILVLGVGALVAGAQALVGIRHHLLRNGLLAAPGPEAVATGAQ